MGDGFRSFVCCLALSTAGTVVACQETSEPLLEPVPPYEPSPVVRLHVTGIVTTSQGQPVIDAGVRVHLVVGPLCYGNHTDAYVRLTDAEGRYASSLRTHTTEDRGCVIVNVYPDRYSLSNVRQKKMAILLESREYSAPPDTVVIDVVFPESSS
ncbi:hypothetical protein [Candidatus Palauibacter sp.]|uniref:hypothetical protein n=1 Tax=Candidatus Palauibacter sp. TaxID=3101350 RepID=UPI003B5AFD70